MTEGAKNCMLNQATLTKWYFKHRKRDAHMQAHFDFSYNYILYGLPPVTEGTRHKLPKESHNIACVVTVSLHLPLPPNQSLV